MVPNIISVDDRYLQGDIPRRQQDCPICGNRSLVVNIHRLTLPVGISYQSTILNDRSQGLIYERIGIGCGCYARLHRQIAHITHSMKERSHV